MENGGQASSAGTVSDPICLANGSTGEIALVGRGHAATIANAHRRFR